MGQQKNKALYPLLQINNLQIDFVTETGTTTAVKNINLTVNRNEIVGIAGESGSGKSVTSLSILKLLPPKSAKYIAGEILFSPNGTEVINITSLDHEALRSIRGGGIGMIFQEPMSSLNPVFTCGGQVMEAIKLHRNISSRDAKNKTIELFEKVKLPAPELLFNRYPHQLSGGQKQRVMIAMAMSSNPSLLICDEPTTALDVTVQKTVLELIRELQAETGMGVIFISHDLGVIAEIAHRVVIMYKGNAVEEGDVKELFRAPRHPYTKGLLACRPALYPRGARLPVVGDFLEREETGDGRRETGEGFSPTGKTYPPLAGVARSAGGGPATREPLIQAKNLSVWFPSSKNFFGKPLSFTKAVDNITFDVFKGETLGLVGESGCGKTTLGRTLLRLIPPTSGQIFFAGRDLLQLSGTELKSFRKNLQIIFQDPYSSLNPSITVGSAIGEPLRVHQPRLTARQRKERVASLLEKVGLSPDHYQRYPHEFSGGQRQRIVIARALILEPDFIICDESVSALDVSIQAQVLNLLNDLRKEFGFTSIFISHDLSVVRYTSNRIMVMNQGRIEEIGEAGQVYTQPRSAYTQKLLDAIPPMIVPA